MVGFYMLILGVFLLLLPPSSVPGGIRRALGLFFLLAILILALAADLVQRLGFRFLGCAGSAPVLVGRVFLLFLFFPHTVIMSVILRCHCSRM